jgi:hypothetical protein
MAARDAAEESFRLTAPEFGLNSDRGLDFRQCYEGPTLKKRGWGTRKIKITKLRQEAGATPFDLAQGKPAPRSCRGRYQWLAAWLRRQA